MHIGDKIRNLRLQKQLTQRELAQKINMTTGYISQIENNLILPSLNTLFLMLKIFKISTVDFFRQEESIMVINKKTDFHIQNNPNLKNKIYHIFKNLDKFKIEPIIIEIKPQGQTELQFKSVYHEFFFILEGEIFLILDKLHYLLKQEDTFYLGANKEYYFLNNQNNKNAKILKIIIF
ncbi:MAG: XRE family transcriptional regulator [Candidatus Phytoplasma australasiaticum]|uniref:XRE family transcriptional regulator n=2 Tax=16SrII (Peanut WB group) TaxID=85621 RepID=A0A9K3WSK7_9MOLU|nr:MULTISPECIES: XRE family transcriptional regulator [Phytoplasma]MCG3566740.1 XRE family transcriptional regulator [Sesame phyllody phytoplasma]MDO8031073.1 XRE family transcriptional regulator [Candidatus Phytoplasma australasiaticum]MDO8031340.1 XRE family transcriptional regulator [Candidatus Phytoplasma australasiaticum]MDO8046381.1 XRE family transcriptional regulator [Candidatus Phytoplasma australasiaticum]MDO8052938.1 XRE family transcriptional regulator [Candidatus Phytoplasma austr